MKHRYLLTGLLLITASTGLPAQTLSLDPDQQRLLGIETATVEASSAVDVGTITMRAEFSPDAQWTLKTPLAGVLQRVLVQQGEAVTTGQALVQIRSAAFVELQRDYLRALGGQQQAAEILARDQRLHEAGSISARRLQAARFDEQAAGAALAALQGQLLLAGLDAGQLRQLRESRALSPELVLRAPADTLVLERSAQAGALLDGSEVLLRLGVPDKLVLTAHVPLILGRQLHEGTRLRAADGSGEAVVVFLSAVVDPASQTLLVRAVPDSPHSLHPGELSQWRVMAGQAVLRVPGRAVVRLGDQDLVYVRVAGGFEPRPVQTVSTTTGYWVITDGLSAGEQVAVKGTAALKGMSLGLGAGEG